MPSQKTTWSAGDLNELAQLLTGVVYVKKTTTYTALATDDVITADATGAAFTVTLPSAIPNLGKVFRIKRLNAAANAVTVDTTSAQTIDGAASKALNTQFAALSVVSDGANWHILSTFGTVA